MSKFSSYRSLERFLTKASENPPQDFKEPKKLATWWKQKTCKHFSVTHIGGHGTCDLCGKRDPKMSRKLSKIRFQ